MDQKADDESLADARQDVERYWAKMKAIRLQQADKNESVMDSDIWRPVVMGFVGGSFIGSAVGLSEPEGSAFGKRQGSHCFASPLRHALPLVASHTSAMTAVICHAAEFVMNARKLAAEAGGSVTRKLVNMCASKALACSG